MAWSLDFYRRYRPVLTLRSLRNLRRALIDERRGDRNYSGERELTLRPPFSTTIRLRPSSNDLYTFDEVLLDRVYSATPPARRVLDLGANIGLSSLYFLSRGAEEVLAVEPDRANAVLLRANLAPFGSRTRILEGAVWATSGTMRFAPPVEPGHVNKGTLSDCGAGYEVPVYSVMDLLETAGWALADLIKMDIEGAETALFASNTEWLTRVRAIAVEFHEGSRQISGFDAVIARHGFRVLSETGHTIVAVRESPP